jgi:hypothetical protein
VEKCVVKQLSESLEGGPEGVSKTPPRRSGRPSPERERLWRDAQRILRETRSVTETAEVLGVPMATLSRWLNAPSKIGWWSAEKRRWKLRSQAARKARWRARKAAERSA